MKKEESIQLAVSKYLKLQYPNVIFTAESSGVRLTLGQAVKAKKQRSPEKGLPDLMIFEAKGNFKGLFIELKAKSPYLKSGELSSQEHIQQQNKVLERLTEKGYYATFATGFNEAKNIIDKYLNLVSENHNRDSNSAR